MSTTEYYKGKVYKIGGYRKTAILNFITKPHPKVLDVGCGDGELGQAIRQEKGGVVHGIDVSVASIQKAVQVLDATFCFDIEKPETWPVQLFTEKYDYIVVSEVLEHLFDTHEVFGMLRKISDNNTEIIITVPNMLFWKNRLNIFFGNFDYTDSGLMDRGHIHVFSWKSFNEMLASEGVRTVEEKNNVPTRGTKMFGKFFPGLFSYQFVVKAKFL